MAVQEMTPMTALNNVQVAEAAAAAAAEYRARVSDYNNYRPLHKAIRQGDWKKAKEIFDRDAVALTRKVTPNGMNALQLAAAVGQWKIVEKLVRLQEMPKDALAEQDLMGFTALHYVSMGGSMRAAKALVTKNRSITKINNLAGQTPLLLAITFSSNKKLVWCLASATIDEDSSSILSSSSSGYLVAALTVAGYHDITMYLVRRYPHLATVSDENGNCVLYAMSRMPPPFQSGNDKLELRERCIYRCIPTIGLDHWPPSKNRGEGDVEDPGRNSRNHHCYFGCLIWKAIDKLVPCVKLVRDIKLRHQNAVKLAEYICEQASIRNNSELWQSFRATNILSNAASSGNVDIIRICFKFFPHLVWSYIPNEGYVIQIAIKNRQEKVFNLVCEMPICKSLVLVLDESENTTSHLAAMVSSSTRLKCAALQLQKDLQWFKAVESLDHPSHKDTKNRDGKTPWQLFRDEHKDMLQRAEKWMKKTSTSCMLVAALIATVAFAASITIPGGSDQRTGYPVLLGDTYLTVFAVSDTLALFSSVFSLMTFLSLLIAPYSEEDFLMALPEKLILGVAALLFALLSTMVAFAIAARFLFLGSFVWLYLMCIALAVIPIHLCRMLHLPLVLKMTKTTYGYGIYSRRRHWYQRFLRRKQKSW